MDKKIYLCGPTNGTTDQLAAFISTRSKIYKILNAEVHWPTFKNPIVVSSIHENEKDLKQSIKTMIDCDIVVTLDGWDADADACTEVSIARKLDMQIFHFTSIDKIK